MFRTKKARVIAAVSPAIVILTYLLYTKKLGAAWDDGYRTGRKAELEDWNWPTGLEKS